MSQTRRSYRGIFLLLQEPGYLDDTSRRFSRHVSYGGPGHTSPPTTPSHPLWGTNDTIFGSATDEAKLPTDARDEEAQRASLTDPPATLVDIAKSLAAHLTTAAVEAWCSM